MQSRESSLPLRSSRIHADFILYPFLKAAGHNVTVATSNSFEPFITDHGLNYGYLSNDLLDLLNPEILDKAGNLFRFGCGYFAF